MQSRLPPNPLLYIGMCYYAESTEHIPRMAKRLLCIQTRLIHDYKLLIPPAATPRSTPYLNNRLFESGIVVSYNRNEINFLDDEMFLELVLSLN